MPTSLSVDAETLRLPDEQYVREAHRKDTVVLHFTAGHNARGAFDSWMATKQRIATAFIIDKDGIVHQCFSPNFWAYHIGIGVSSLEKRSIGIELVNIGPLTRDGDILRNWTGSKHCTMDETERYLHTPFRGREYWERFTGTQYESCRALVDELCELFAIRREIQSCAAEGNSLDFPLNASGILTHSNFRKDKWDVGPAFEWARIS